MSSFVLNQEVESMLKRIIKNNFGTLSDLPKELSNTILNIYYRSIVRNLQSEGKKGIWFPPEILNSDDFAKSYKDYIIMQGLDIEAMESLPGLIKALRELRSDSTQDKSVYKYNIELAIDIYKYNIEDTENKSQLMRSIERKFAKVSEIPNLADIVII